MAEIDPRIHFQGKHSPKLVKIPAFATLSARAANAAFTAFKILIYFPRMDESSLPNGRGVADDDVELPEYLQTPLPVTGSNSPRLRQEQERKRVEREQELAQQVVRRTVDRDPDGEEFPLGLTKSYS